nr:MAG TPA: rich Immunoreceptor tyrosine-based activation motif [Caudoviricetes sp.]
MIIKNKDTYLGRCFIFTKFLKNFKIPLDFCGYIV